MTIYTLTNEKMLHEFVLLTLMQSVVLLSIVFRILLTRVLKTLFKEPTKGNYSWKYK